MIPQGTSVRKATPAATASWPRPWKRRSRSRDSHSWILLRATKTSGLCSMKDATKLATVQDGDDTAKMSWPSTVLEHTVQHAGRPLCCRCRSRSPRQLVRPGTPCVQQYLSSLCKPTFPHSGFCPPKRSRHEWGGNILAKEATTRLLRSCVGLKTTIVVITVVTSLQP